MYDKQVEMTLLITFVPAPKEAALDQGDITTASNPKTHNKQPGCTGGVPQTPFVKNTTEATTSVQAKLAFTPDPPVTPRYTH